MIFLPSKVDSPNPTGKPPCDPAQHRGRRSPSFRIYVREEEHNWIEYAMPNSPSEYTSNRYKIAPQAHSAHLHCPKRKRDYCTYELSELICAEYIGILGRVQLHAAATPIIIIRGALDPPRLRHTETAASAP